ncbi:UNVERIFIED_CONTAM: hypothetical protein Sradi_2807900 [Sesamum radiatum]|uniref:Uncharacterized protein n=1 Tax=Sesamum radiatum TaxID=300843 RepID=A0AAW2RXD3_SESRA
MLVDSWHEIYYGGCGGSSYSSSSSSRKLETRIPSLRATLQTHNHRKSSKGKAQKCCEVAGLALQFVISAVLGIPPPLLLVLLFKLVPRLENLNLWVASFSNSGTTSRSCDGSRSATTTVTAKLVLLDGQLQEFSWPIKVSFLLQQNPDCFICSSDEMEFDQFVAEIGGDEVLQPGEVYFELPLRWRNQRLQAEDMAALAVKASVALSDTSKDRMSRCGCCVSRKIEPVVVLFGEQMTAAADGGGGKGGAGGHYKGRKFGGGKLSAISEE